jgi:hypothetical protein
MATRSRLRHAGRVLGAVGARKRWNDISLEQRREIMRRVREGKRSSANSDAPYAHAAIENAPMQDCVGAGAF